MLFLEHAKLWGVADPIKIKDAQTDRKYGS